MNDLLETKMITKALVVVMVQEILLRQIKDVGIEFDEDEIRDTVRNLFFCKCDERDICEINEQNRDK
jgi:hypothetical protein